MPQGFKHLLALLAVSFLTLAGRAAAYEADPSSFGENAVTKLCREAWHWIAGACGAAGGYITDHDLIFWLGVLLLLLSVIIRCYEILIRCRRYRAMKAGDRAGPS